MSTTTEPLPPGQSPLEPSGDSDSDGTGSGGPDERRRRLRRPRVPVPRLDRPRLPYGLIAPAVVFMTLVHVVPMVAGGYLSFTGLTRRTYTQLFGAPWVGWDNYRDLLFNETLINKNFLGAAQNTAVYTTTTVALSLAGGLGMALLLNRNRWGQRAARSLVLVPWVMPTFVVALLWRNMWQSDIGIVNTILVDWTGLLNERPQWLVGSNSLWALIVPSIWRGLPLAMLLFLAGLQAIPEELHQAAATDGANAWQRFWHVTFPLLRPLLAVQLLFGVVYTSYQYPLPTIMMGDDPGDNAELIMTLVVRESFDRQRVGWGAAMSVLLMAGMFVWVAIWFAGFRRDLELTK